MRDHMWVAEGGLSWGEDKCTLRDLCDSFPPREHVTVGSVSLMARSTPQ
jgi:hypothetical protein